MVIIVKYIQNVSTFEKSHRDRICNEVISIRGTCCSDIYFIFMEQLLLKVTEFKILMALLSGPDSSNLFCDQVSLTVDTMSTLQQPCANSEDRYLLQTFIFTIEHKTPICEFWR